MIPEFRRVVGQSFEPPSHTHWRYDFREKVISAHTVQRSESFSEATFRTSYVFSSGSGLGKRYFSEVRVRVGIWLGKKSGFNDPTFGPSSFAWRYDARRFSARTHSCMLKQFFPRHSNPNFKPTEIPTRTLTKLKDPYPNPNPTEIPLPGCGPYISYGRSLQTCLNRPEFTLLFLIKCRISEKRIFWMKL